MPYSPWRTGSPSWSMARYWNPESRKPFVPVRRCNWPTWAARSCSMTEVLLEASGLHTFYDVSHILHGVDFSVRRGETIGLMGRNGMGKTTLLKTMLGLVRPREGQVRVRGE